MTKQGVSIPCLCKNMPYDMVPDSDRELPQPVLATLSGHNNTHQKWNETSKLKTKNASIRIMIKFMPNSWI